MRNRKNFLRVAVTEGAGLGRLSLRVNRGVIAFAALTGCAAMVPVLCGAGPLVFEESARITSPDPAFDFPLRVAVEGDTIIATGRKFDGPIETHVAFLFRRQSNGEWTYIRSLAEGGCDSGEGAEDTCNASVAIRNGLALVTAGTVHVFRRLSDGTWVEEPSEGSIGPGDAAVGTGAVLASESNGCAWTSYAYRQNSAGVWTSVATMPGLALPCDPWGLFGHDVDMSAGNRVILGTTMYDDEVDIYEPSGTTWAHTATLTNPVSADLFGEAVAIDDSRAFVSGMFDAPIHVYTRDSGTWTHAGAIAPPDSQRHSPPIALNVRDLVVASFGGDPHRNGSIGVFQQTSPGEFEQVARLVASDSTTQPLYLGSYDVDIDLNGSSARVVAASRNGLYVFDLDGWGTTPPPAQETFETGNAGNWTPMAGSSFSVVPSGISQVYRQSSVLGDAGAFVTGIDWKDQAIEADLTPTAFEGTNRWVGLAVRRTDANNYYYLALRQSNVLELKRIVDGTFVTLVAKPIPVALNRTYRLRLEAIGTLVRAYVDGALVAEVHDTALTHGHAGVRMYKARADFDNVILSHDPHLTLFDMEEDSFRGSPWSFGLGNWVGVQNPSQGNAYEVQQHDTNGDARAVIRVSANNQIVQARVTPNSFASGTGSRWFGVLARYTDDENYYYVTVRSDNTISLRKLVDGAIHVLDTAPLTVSTGTSYDLRLEAVESALRVYVNGNLLLEADDTSHPSGKYGMVTYKAAATYRKVRVWEP
jgi:hypothetical protein